jgi:hypothetical protein
MQEEMIGAPNLVFRHRYNPIPRAKNKEWHSEQLNRDVAEETRPRASTEQQRRCEH